METIPEDKPTKNVAPLRYHKKLDAFAETIDANYHEQSLQVYRTVKTNPPTDADLVPQRYEGMSYFEIEELLIEYTEEDIAEMTEQEKKDEVSGDAISVNTTLERCIKSAIKTYQTVKRKYPESAESFKENRGCYVARLIINPQHGLISRPKNGHMNSLLREGVGIADIWDKTFEVVQFDYDAESDEDN